MLSILTKFAAIGDACDPVATSNRFLGLPHWFEYLSGEEDALGKCIPTVSWASGGNISDLWLIGLAGVDILLRIVALVAIGFVIYGGFLYMTSSGEPDRTKTAKDTILNALIGMAIAIVASGVVSFIGNTIK